MRFYVMLERVVEKRQQCVLAFFPFFLYNLYKTSWNFRIQLYVQITAQIWVKWTTHSYTKIDDTQPKHINQKYPPSSEIAPVFSESIL